MKEVQALLLFSSQRTNSEGSIFKGSRDDHHGYSYIVSMMQSSGGMAETSTSPTTSVRTSETPTAESSSSLTSSGSFSSITSTTETSTSPTTSSSSSLTSSGSLSLTTSTTETSTSPTTSVPTSETSTAESSSSLTSSGSLLSTASTTETSTSPKTAVPTSETSTAESSSPLTSSGSLLSTASATETSTSPTISVPTSETSTAESSSSLTSSGSPSSTTSTTETSTSPTTSVPTSETPTAESSSSLTSSGSPSSTTSTTETSTSPTTSVPTSETPTAESSSSLTSSGSPSSTASATETSTSPTTAHLQQKPPLLQQLLSPHLKHLQQSHLPLPHLLDPPHRQQLQQKPSATETSTSPTTSVPTSETSTAELSSPLTSSGSFQLNTSTTETSTSPTTHLQQKPPLLQQLLSPHLKHLQQSHLPLPHLLDPPHRQQLQQKPSATETSTSPTTSVPTSETSTAESSSSFTSSGSPSSTASTTKPSTSPTTSTSTSPTSSMFPSSTLSRSATSTPPTPSVISSSTASTASVAETSTSTAFVAPTSVDVHQTQSPTQQSMFPTSSIALITHQVTESTQPVSSIPTDQPHENTTILQTTTLTPTSRLHETPPPPTVLPTTTTTASPGIQNFTVNFTTTSLKYRSEMADPNSRVFNSTARVMSRLLHQMVGGENNELGILGCQPTGFRSVRNGNETGVDAICTYRYDSTFDRVKMYGEIVDRTQNFTKTGPYLLDRDSLYVNGFHETPPPTTVLPTTTTTASPGTQTFTVNFTITSLKYRSEMGVPNSRTFSSTARVVSRLLHQMVGKDSNELGILGCQPTGFRSLRNGNETGVDAICTYRYDSTFDRVKMYGEIVARTQNFTKTGPYLLERDSLYVNGFHETPPTTTVLPTTTTTPSTGIQDFTVNFTITSLTYRSEMGVRNSRRFNSTARSVSKVLHQTIEASSNELTILGCQATSFRSLEDGDHTGVDAICTYRKDSPTDRKQIYHGIVNTTNGFMKMGPYQLDQNSLYVNGYKESASKAYVSYSLLTLLTTTVATTTKTQTLGNLRYTTDLGKHGSRKFSSTERVIRYYWDFHEPPDHHPCPVVSAERQTLPQFSLGQLRIPLGV
ncbi:flocculation protein FLO11-like [Sphaerodactylus townsendi]|uniref:flocculation protein FLO11-like n=1 Tax=Sphaerodactylus townsendi TaxID=933632 RepID=UPI002026337E|nr:flocculation protein FLO11-like [Sphaerodactylus townsendi]